MIINSSRYRRGVRPRSRALAPHGDHFGRAERAALAWCEALTLLPSCGAPDELFEELKHHFSDEQIVALTLAIVAINGWNRLNVAFRTPVSDAAKVTHPEAA